MVDVNSAYMDHWIVYKGSVLSCVFLCNGNLTIIYMETILLEHASN